MTFERPRTLTAEQVAEIRQILGEGRTSSADIARQYGVVVATIYNIAHRVTWKQIPGPPPRRRPRTNTGFWGVTANGMGNRFNVTINGNPIRRSLGVFKDPIEAARGYDARARELGFIPEKLNFPDDP